MFRRSYRQTFLVVVFLTAVLIMGLIFVFRGIPNFGHVRPKVDKRTLLVQMNNQFNNQKRMDIEYNRIIQPTEEIEANCTIISESNCINGDIEFYLLTSENPKNEQLLTFASPLSIINAKFMPNRTVTVYIHGGLGGSRNDNLTGPVAEELLQKKGGMNVILVDYHKVSEIACLLPGTLHPRVNTLLIAQCISQMIQAILIYRPDVTIDQFHIVGFSIGAHISGQIANFPGILNVTYPRMTGIDPAGPGYSDIFNTKEDLLTEDDAEFVVIIHTNVRVYGEIYPAGSLDFYVNSGVFQPGCPANFPICNHVFALALYIESINEIIELPMEKCPNIETFFVKGGCEEKEMVKFGEHADKRTRGIYFLKTNRSNPFIGTRKLTQYQIFKKYEIIYPTAEKEGLI